MSRRGRRRDGGRGGAGCSCPASAYRQSDRPEEHGQRRRADDIAPGKQVAGWPVEADAEVPDEMAEAAEHVVEKRPAVAEEDEQPEPGAEEAVGDGEGALTRC